MHYPVMTERQVAFRWKISLKTLRRWRLDGEGPIWHKFFQHVRYHEANIHSRNATNPPGADWRVSPEGVSSRDATNKPASGRVSGRCEGREIR